MSARTSNAAPKRPARVSVVTAFLNAEQYLPEAVESVLAQTFDSWELLLIDDGSGDSSTRIAREYEASHPGRIRYLEHNAHGTRGAGASRNLGLARAKAEYVAILDADDVWKPRRLEKQVAFLDSHPDVALVGSWYTEIDSRGRTLRRGRKPCSDLDIRWAMLFYSPFLHSTVLFRRRPVLEQVGGYDDTLHTSQDFELWIRVTRRFRVANLADYLVRYRVHDASLTSTRGARAQVGHRLRVRRASELAGWSQEEFDVQERRLDAMSRLLTGNPAGRSVEELQRAVEDIFRLQSAFCREAGLVGPTAARHRARVRAEVSENLVVLAAGLGLLQHPGARSLLRRAYQLHPRVYFRADTLVRSLMPALRGLLTQRRRPAARPAMAEPPDRP
jgi:GT2 family glycosyltransferase